MLLGTIVNSLAILLGTLIGVLIPNMSERMQKTVIQGLALAVIGLGLQMTFTASNFLIVILSVVIGGVLGEWWRLEDRLNSVGRWIELKVNERTKERAPQDDNKKSVATAFVTATLVYCIGAMAVVGSMDSGLRNDHTVLYTKSLLDGFSAIIFTSTLGFGVAFSAIVVFVYQATIVFASSLILEYLGSGIVDQVVAGITATGGLLILAIGLNVMELTRIRVANLLPALGVTICLVVVYQWIG